MKTYSMKMLAIIIVTISSSIGCKAQRNISHGSNSEIRIANMDERSILVNPMFWNEDSVQIIKQIGTVKFDKIKFYLSQENLPKEMKYKIKFAHDSIARRQFNDKLAELKIHKVIAFEHKFQGQDFGKYVIVEIPFNENVGWDPSAKWDTVYFLFPEKAVEEVNKL